MIGRRAALAGLGAVLGMALVPARARPIAKVLDAHTLTVAVYKDFEPWSWRDGSGLRGIDVELAKALADGLGVGVAYQELAAGENVEEDLRNAVWRGSLIDRSPADLMMHVPVDRQFAARNDRAVIFGPYYREGFAMVCNREALDCEASPADYRGHRLAAELDSVPDFYLTGSFGGALRGDVQHVPSGQAAVLAVAEGRADAAVATRAQAEHGLADAGGRLTLRRGALPMLTVPGWDVGLAVKDDSHDLADRLEAIVEKLVADGTVAAICARYGVTHRAPVA